MAHGSLRRISGDDMTHNELVARVNKLEDSYDTEGYAWGALKAVVELHNPVDVSWKNDGSKILCSTCSEGSDVYPCPTIQAIEKELI